MAESQTNPEPISQPSECTHWLCPGRIWRATKKMIRRHLPRSIREWVNLRIGREGLQTRLMLNSRLVSESTDLMSRLYLGRNSNYDVIILPIIDWDFRFQRPQHLARQFACNGHRVFYVRPNSPPNHFFNGRNYYVRPQEPNLAEVELPRLADLNIYKDRSNQAVLKQWMESIKDLSKDYAISNAVLLVQLPFWTDFALEIRNKFGWKMIYDCMDKHSGFSTNNNAMLEAEENLSRKSDLVIATAAILQKEQKEFNPNCELIPNACQFEHFSTSFGRIPESIAHLPKPIIGYYGAISDWFDSEMVAEMAKAKPNWSFVFIGSTYGADLTPFNGLANVHLLGEQSYGSLPGYLHAFDVALIPFKIIPLTEATNPVKLYEYLSAGKPVVSVPLPEVVPYGDGNLVHIASDAEETINAIEEALNQNSPELTSQRRQLAQKNTWEKRFIKLHSSITKLYEKVSIIVLTYNNLHMNKLCIDSIFRNTLWPNFELIIIDNASADETPGYLTKVEQFHENVRIILNKENLGFARGNNQGIQIAQGEYIVLLNNDTMVTRGWLSRLLQHLLRDPKAGMVGPVTNAIANEAKIDVDYITLDDMESFAEQRYWEYAGKNFPIKVLALFCALARKETLEKIGMLDERFKIGMFEDDDLALRLQQAGFHSLCAQDVFIHHFLSESFKLLGEDGFSEVFQVNRKRFEEKWSQGWSPHKYSDKAG